MPALINGDVGASIETLAEGFEFLKDEYCRLAHSYLGLQAKAAQVEEQCSSLRLLLSRNPPSELAPEETLITPKLESIPSKSLLEHLETNSQPNRQHALTRIKEAEFEAVKVKPRCGNMDGSVLNSSKAGTENHVERERDFTIPGKMTGNLGCPFAAGGGKPSQNGLPTPRSSSVALRSYSRQSRRRTSTGEPIATTRSQRPSLLSSVASAAEGPQCPIRFLDSHSPEEIAEFLKHNSDKLPRSHEVCITRFQQNPGEMDAKYGDLPRLIEGIGRKHQSFMPPASKNASHYADDGNVEDAEIDEDLEELDSKSHKRVESWAKGLEPNPNVIPEENEEEEEERVPHFDRPLRDIRVGESPSRPWGVPIPSKYLDAPPRRDSDFSSQAAAPEDIGVIPKPSAAKAEAITTDTPATDPKPKGKCPFDHTAMAAKKTSPKVETPEPPPTATKAAKPAPKVVKTTSPAHADTRATILNKGVIIVRAAEELENLSVQNEGTMLLGYKSERVHYILEALGQQAQQ